MADLVSEGGRAAKPFSPLGKRLAGYGIAIVAVAIAVLIRLALERIESGIPPFITLFPAVFVAALWGGRGAGALALVMGVVAATYFWLPPERSLSLSAAARVNAALFIVFGAMTVWAAHLLRSIEHERNRLAARLLSAQQTSLDGFAILQAQRNTSGEVADFSIVYINEAAAGVLRRPRTALLHARLSSILPGLSMRPALIDGLRRVLETGEAAFTEGQYDADGYRGWYRVSLVKLEDGVAVRLRDITDAVSRQRALDDSRERLRAALDAAAIGTWRREPDAEVSSWDAPLSRIFGLPAEARTMSLEEILSFVHPDDRAAFERKGRLLPSEGVHHFEFRIVRADGQVRVLRDSGRCMRDRSGRWIATGACMDITEQVRNRDRLSERELRLGLAIEGAGIGIADFDVRTGEGYWSERFCAIIGVAYQGQTVKRGDWTACVHPDDLSLVAARYRAAHRTGRYECEHRIIRRDTGEVRFVHAFGSVLKGELAQRSRIVVVLRDITERMRDRDALSDRELRLALAVEGAGLGMADFDITAGRGFWSPRFCEIVGVPFQAEGVRNEDWIASVHPDDIGPAMALYQAARQTGRYDSEYRVLRPATGEIRYVHALGSILKDAGGRPVRLIAMLQDVTDRRTAERELQERERRLLLATEGTGLGTCEIDLRTGRGVWSRRLFEILGCPPRDDGAASLEEWMEQIHTEDRDSTRHALQQALTTEKVRIEFRTGGDADTVRWVECHGIVVRDTEGEPGRFLGVFLDISPRRAAEEMRDLLAREVDHRARNLFAIVQAIVRLTKASDLADYRRAVEARVQVLARSHTLLSDAAWMPPTLTALIERELAAYGAGRVSLAGPPVRLQPAAVTGFSLIVHELATNAARHGALSVETGRLAVSWQLDRSQGLRLSWRESGGPLLVDPPLVRGFGSDLIANAVHELGGTFAKTWREEGLLCEIAIPAERHLTEAQFDGAERLRA